MKYSQDKVIRVFSDLHLGHCNSTIKSVTSLDKLWLGCDQVVFNGDLWEEKLPEFHDRGQQMVSELFRKLEQVGVEYLCLAGNHDPLYTKKRYYQPLAEIVILHGDMVYPEGSPWRVEVFRYAEDVKQMIVSAKKAGWSLDERALLATRMATELKYCPPQISGLLGRLISIMKDPRILVRIFQVWRGAPKSYVNFAEEYFPSGKVLCSGHFHKPGYWNINEKHVLNTGAFMSTSRPYCIEIRGNTVVLRSVIKNGDYFEFSHSMVYLDL